HALGIGPLNCGAITAVEPVDATPAPALLTAYPNPFNPKTRVRFVQPADGPARVTVHGVDGRLLRTLFDATLPAGEHHAEWDGRDDAGHAMSSGVYFLRFEGAGASAGAKLVMLR
ncbi:T9SS type A sorting domain-containing protein, partial [bacterium]|nr:T9SS type A sorting domain-containing protein [bacterium]